MRKEVKLSFFGNDMILYIENPKDTTRKLLELINELGKVASNKGFPSSSHGKRACPQCRQSNKINSQKYVMFGRVAGYKINTQKSVAFLYNKQKIIRKELKKQSHLPLHQKEYLGTNLPKEIKDLYIRNYKTLMKEIKEESILLK